ncbi:MAG: hypothetical protein MZU91_02550 [Desulfosudis oleivorans]|nr:hypothetical protein [Desulfosudis oleivorans]
MPRWLLHTLHSLLASFRSLFLLERRRSFKRIKPQVRKGEKDEKESYQYGIDGVVGFGHRGFGFIPAQTVLASEPVKQQGTVDNALVTFRNFMAGQGYGMAP